MPKIHKFTNSATHITAGRAVPRLVRIAWARMALLRAPAAQVGQTAVPETTGNRSFFLPSPQCVAEETVCRAQCVFEIVLDWLMMMM
jgi:hypothetical protein